LIPQCALELGLALAASCWWAFNLVIKFGFKVSFLNASGKARTPFNEVHYRLFPAGN